MPGYAALGLFWAVCMFSAAQQKDPQSSQSHASAIFGDVAALQAAHRRLSGEHPEANDKMNKRAKISKTKRADQLSSQKRAQRVSGRIAKDAFVRNRSDKLKCHESCCSKECSKNTSFLQMRTNYHK